MVTREGKQVCTFCIPSGVFIELYSNSCSNCGRINEDFKPSEPVKVSSNVVPDYKVEDISKFLKKRKR